MGLPLPCPPTLPIDTPISVAGRGRQGVLIGGTTQRPHYQLLRRLFSAYLLENYPLRILFSVMSQPRPRLIQVARDGKIIGDFTLSSLGQALRDEVVLKTDHYWREGKSDWERVSYIADEAEDETAKKDPPPPPPSKGKGKYAYLFMLAGFLLFGWAMGAGKYGVIIGYTTVERFPGKLFPIYKYPVWPDVIVPLGILLSAVLWVIGWRRRKL